MSTTVVPTTSTTSTPVPRDAAVVIPAWVVDFDSYRRWLDSDEAPDRGRISWFDGELVLDMTGQEIGSHGLLKALIQRRLGVLLEEANLGEIHHDPTSFVHDETRMVHEPDAMVVLWESLDTGRVSYREITEGSGRFIEVVGEVDIVVEVVSRSSVRKDTLLLPGRYFEAGVREYWIVDARDERLELDVRIRGESEFESVPADAEGWVRSPVLDRSFRLERVTTAGGRSRYQLESR